MVAPTVLAVLVSCGNVDQGPVARPTTTDSPTTTECTTTTAVPAPTTTATTTPTTAASAPTSEPSTSGLRKGDRGEAVRALQEQLTGLGYWSGPSDGVFGTELHHAVVALQKAADLARDGVAGPVTLAAVARGIRPAHRTTQGPAVEIDLTRQLLLVVRNGRLEAIFDTSTGRRPGTTPRGHWSVTREIDGYHRSALGLLYRPKYFHRGVAMHGYTSVPPHPASHGCVRVTYAAMDHIWDTHLMPIGMPVWVY
jgi:hypothetical protein